MPKAEKEKVLKSDSLYKGRELSVRRDTVELPSGEPYEQEVAEWPDEVVAVPRASDNEVVLVQQYRRGAGEILLELPGGKLREGEDELSAIGRELEEETGYRAGSLEKIAETFIAPGWSTFKCGFFLAQDLEPVENPKPQDPDENVEVVRMPFAKALAAVEDGGIRDAKTALGLLLAKEFFPAA